MYVAGHAVRIEGRNKRASVEASPQGGSDLRTRCVPKLRASKPERRAALISNPFASMPAGTILRSHAPMAGRDRWGRASAESDGGQRCCPSVCWGSRPRRVPAPSTGQGGTAPMPRLRHVHTESRGIGLNTHSSASSGLFTGVTGGRPVPWEMLSLT